MRNQWTSRGIWRVSMVVLMVAVAAAVAGAADWNDPDAVAAAREGLVDLLFSDRIDRIDFQATTYEQGAALIDRAVDGAMRGAREVAAEPASGGQLAAGVIRAFNDHRSRGLATTLIESEDFVIATEDTAATLGDVLGEATRLVGEHVGAEATSERVTDAATNLFRAVVMEPDGGLTYLEQYREHLDTVAALPAGDRIRFFER